MNVLPWRLPLGSVLPLGAAVAMHGIVCVLGGPGEDTPYLDFSSQGYVPGLGLHAGPQPMLHVDHRAARAQRRMAVGFVFTFCMMLAFLYGKRKLMPVSRSP
ncbi:hypothetical protein Emed_003125 [Eimeria media]